jgi:hypothetical protein
MSWVGDALGRNKGKKQAAKAKAALAAATKKFTEEAAAMKKQTDQIQSYAYQKDALARREQKKASADAEAQRVASEMSKAASPAQAIQRENEEAASVNTPTPNVAPPAETPQQAKIAALGGGAGAASAPAIMAKKEEAKPAPTLNAFTMPSTKNVQFGGS